MLTNSLKITDSTKTEFLETIYFQSDQKYAKNIIVEIYAVFRIVYHVECP